MRMGDTQERNTATVGCYVELRHLPSRREGASGARVEVTPQNKAHSHMIVDPKSNSWKATSGCRHAATVVLKATVIFLLDSRRSRIDGSC